VLTALPLLIPCDTRILARRGRFANPIDGLYKLLLCTGPLHRRQDSTSNRNSNYREKKLLYVCDWVYIHPGFGWRVLGDCKSSCLLNMRSLFQTVNIYN
jgi:hypothetical protein